MSKFKFNDPQRLFEGIKVGELSFIPEAAFHGYVPGKSFIPLFMYRKYFKK